MSSRLDALIEQLRAQSADALLVEAGNTMFLAKGKESIPLLNARLSNAHVTSLLRDAAPPDARLSIERGETVEFDYVSPSGPVRVEFRVVEDRYFARVTPDEFRDSLDLMEPSASLAPPKPASRETALPQPAVDTTPMPPLPGQGPRPAIEDWFEIFFRTGASDLHLTPGLPAMIRSVDGDVREIPEIPEVGAYELEQMLLHIMPPQNRDEWLHTRDTDFAYDVGTHRLRVNVFCDLRGPCAAFRRIPGDILTLEQLGLPKIIQDFCRLKKGLVLVTGPTGSGKSTTLAAMIDWINETRADHIVTIEDPIEFVHQPKRCLIHQRQVGVHTASFSRALRAALREDPDIILVGEMRDLETIAIAIEMAETGHLVLATLHTTTAATTVDRIIDQFGADKQEQVRQMLAESLKGVVSQTLCKRKDGGRVLALEVLGVNTAVSNMIREKKTYQIASVMQTSRAHGMRTLTDSLMDLVKQGVIDAQEAIDRAVDKSSIKRDLAANQIAVNGSDL
jgi:twitching motility protein PilT